MIGLRWLAGAWCLFRTCNRRTHPPFNIQVAKRSAAWLYGARQVRKYAGARALLTKLGAADLLTGLGAISIGWHVLDDWWLQWVGPTEVALALCTRRTG